MAHDIYVINPRVNGVKVQKYLENFRKKSLCLSHRFFFLLVLKHFSGGNHQYFQRKKYSLYLLKYVLTQRMENQGLTEYKRVLYGY